MRLGSLVFAVFMLCLLTWRWGYQYGTNDQVELLPYTLFLSDHSFYPHDFFIQSLHANVPNERTVMATLLLPFIGHMEFWNLLFHIVCSIVLFVGLDHLGKMLLKDAWLARLAIVVSFVLFYDYGPGGNEIWLAGFQAGSVACALIPYAIILFLQSRYKASALLFGILSLIQSLDGLNVWAAFTAVLLILCFAKKVEWKVWLQWCAIYLLVAAPLLLGIFLSKSGVESSLTNAEVYNIMFRFRHPHHFIFSTFPKSHVFIFLLLSVFAMLYFVSAGSKMFLFIAVSMLAMLCYGIAVDVFHFVPIANFQVYKLGQWVKLLGVFGMLGLVKNYLPLDYIKQRNTTATVAMAAATLLIFGGLLLLPAFRNPHADYQFAGNDDDAIAICKMIEKSTPKDAVFIQPFAFTATKWHAKRSCYVEFKANVRNKAFVGEWYRRIRQLYGVDYRRNEMGFDMEQKANSHFNNLSAAELNQLKQAGVTHVLTTTGAIPPGFMPLIQNHSYAVFKL